MPAAVNMLFLFAMLASSSLVSGAGFLHGTKRNHFALHGASISEINLAIGEVFGCGEQSNPSHLPAIKRSIEPIWIAIPKNQKGLVEWRLLRYVAHRYFMKESNFMVRGFEPTQVVNESNLGAAHVLDSKMPSVADKLMSGRKNTEGFSLDDTVAMIAVLEQLIFDSESSVLESLYQKRDTPISARISHNELEELMEEYLIHWMFSYDEETMTEILNSRGSAEEFVNHWHATLGLVQGMVKSMELSRQRAPATGQGNAILTRSYSFDDAHEVVGLLTRSFGSYWETECQATKQALVDMDTSGTGRVLLKDFYGSNLDGEWRFAESESYLRDIGALDDSSLRGPQVIIPNYMQAASNCIVSNSNYNVCCRNECEDILGDIEVAVGAPIANVDQILRLIGNMSSSSDQSIRVDAMLASQLQHIADVHGNQVPLHGRLFAQWLHYMFPRECAFPHRAGTVSALTPVERGDDSIASQDEVERQASASIPSDELAANAELDAMSQWTEDEELLVDYPMRMHTQRDRHGLLLTGSVVVLLALAVIAVALRSLGYQTAVSIGRPEQNGKPHFV